MLWIEKLVVRSNQRKLFDVAPPVLTRAFQELSDGAWPFEMIELTAILYYIILYFIMLYRFILYYIIYHIMLSFYFYLILYIRIYL